MQLAGTPLALGVDGAIHDHRHDSGPRWGRWIAPTTSPTCAATATCCSPPRPPGSTDRCRPARAGPASGWSGHVGRTHRWTAGWVATGESPDVEAAPGRRRRGAVGPRRARRADRPPSRPSTPTPSCRHLARPAARACSGPAAWRSRPPSTASTPRPPRAPSRPSPPTWRVDAVDELFEVVLTVRGHRRAAAHGPDDPPPRHRSRARRRRGGRRVARHPRPRGPRRVDARARQGRRRRAGPGVRPAAAAVEPPGHRRPPGVRRRVDPGRLARPRHRADRAGRPVASGRGRRHRGAPTPWQAALGSGALSLLR